LQGGIITEISAEKKATNKRSRNHTVNFRVTEQEREMIQRRMEQTGMENLRAYLLKMAIDGRVIHIELESVREMVRLLSNVTNNINQVKHCV
jgi:nicotinamide mononucleotide adenylyltransferase